jgi:hypothetical protein
MIRYYMGHLLPSKGTRWRTAVILDFDSRVYENSVFGYISGTN